MPSAINTSQATFDTDVLNAGRPVLVDFWAEWCGPCKAIGPIVDQIAAERSGELTVVKVDIVENPEIASRFGVRNLPTLMIFKDGQIEASRSGAAGKGQINQWIDSALQR